MQINKHNGFTLLELLVSLMIISLMTAVVGFTVSGHQHRTLKTEADKLAAKLNAAQLQIATGASALRLIATNKGYAFEIAERSVESGNQPQWKLVLNDDILGEYPLPNAIKLSINDPVLIAKEPVGLPITLYLIKEDLKVSIATDGIQAWASQ